MKNTLNPLMILVTGDITMDWNFAQIDQENREAIIWDSKDTVDLFWQRGGASLLADLLIAVGAELQVNNSVPIEVRQPSTPKTLEEVSLGDPNFHHSFAIWAKKKYAEKPPLDKEKAWRVGEFLGTRRAKTPCPTMKVEDDPSMADIVVLDDANMGFREARDCWPLALNNQANQPSWVIYKMANPIAHGPLWEYLHREHAERTAVITTVNELRLTEVKISRELSWERTAQDVFWELIHNPCINSLSHCAHVIVSFGTAGAILLSRQKDQVSRCSLIFDPRFIEGAWMDAHPGGGIGYTTCLTAGIVRQLILNTLEPNIKLGIQSGLTAMRSLHAEGYGERGAPLTQSPLTFPIRPILASLATQQSKFAVVEVQDPLRYIKQANGSEDKPLTSGFWTILEDRYQNTLDQVSEQIVRVGPEVTLQGVPLGQFGNLLTVDRQEIESFRSIRALVGEYCQKVKQKRPLSIAVFGAPGSGKSFGIIEVANSLLPGQIEVREFNLSQFASNSDLTSALHQVRDISLTGKIPLIFWDEFDTSFNNSPLGWLRYFLAPMQDGRFQEGQISHPIGRSIFVFAGGTAVRMTDFGQGLAADRFKAVKGPDFVSRLKGYVNILGPNQVRNENMPTTEDPYFIIRRAILLRSILKRNVPDLFENGKLNIDSGVLRAMLKTVEYRHGVRSMESIIAMSQLTGMKSFERSSLPAESQLDLHVNGQNFLSLVQQIELEGEILEKLAEAAHEIYREGLKKRKSQSYAGSFSYADLPEDFKEQNRRTVRDIPVKLAKAGYAMIPARSNEPPFNFPGEPLEQLAEMEHESYLQAKLADDWKYAPETNKDKKLNKTLLPWDQLPEDEKEKDRDLVRGIPKMLAWAGFAIVKTQFY